MAALISQTTGAWEKLNHRPNVYITISPERRCGLPIVARDEKLPGKVESKGSDPEILRKWELGGLAAEQAWWGGPGIQLPRWGCRVSLRPARETHRELVSDKKM